jgi:hypothetical protein
MGVEPPFIYDHPSRYSFSGPTEKGFNPKAATQASWSPPREKPKQDGPLLNFNKHPDSVGYFPFAMPVLSNVVPVPNRALWKHRRQTNEPKHCEQDQILEKNPACASNSGTSWNSRNPVLCHRYQRDIRFSRMDHSHRSGCRLASHPICGIPPMSIGDREDSCLKRKLHAVRDHDRRRTTPISGLFCLHGT